MPKGSRIDRYRRAGGAPRSGRVLVLAPRSRLGVVGTLRRPLLQERVVGSNERIGRRHRVGVIDRSVLASERYPARILAKAVLELRAHLFPPVLQPLRRGVQYPRDLRSLP